MCLCSNINCNGLDNSCVSLLVLLKDLDVPEIHQKHLISKTTTIAIHSTYFAFCCQTKDWTDPDLMDVNFFSQLYIDMYFTYFFIFMNYEAANSILLNFGEV